MKARQILTCGIAIALSMQARAALIEIKSMTEYDKQMLSGRPTVIKFFTPWCGACTANKPDFDALINDPTLAHIDFALINFDDQADIGQREKIEAFPTFVYLHKGGRVTTIVGGQRAAIMRQDVLTRFPAVEVAVQEEPTPKIQKEPTAQSLSANVSAETSFSAPAQLQGTESGDKPEVAPQSEDKTGVWYNVKKGFNWVVDGIASAGSYVGKKIKNLFS